jgi:hypothetical protein
VLFDHAPILRESPSLAKIGSPPPTRDAGRRLQARAACREEWKTTWRNAMQTLISVFDDRSNARKAVDRLVKTGFTYDDVHLKEGDATVPPDDEAVNRDVGERTMHTAEREVAVDRGVLDSLGHFFVSLFGEDDGKKAADGYGKSVQRGHSVVIVDAHTDQEAETAAVILHEQGAIEVEDHETAGGTPAKPGVRMYQRDARPTLRDLAQQRQLREESLLADRAGQVSQDKQDREERAYASGMTRVDIDRPK